MALIREEEAVNHGNTLYVTGLSSRVTERDIKDFFSKEGRVVGCHVVLEPHTRVSRGFAFVTMDTVEEADRCIKYLNNSEMEGRNITVEKVTGMSVETVGDTAEAMAVVAMSITATVAAAAAAMATAGISSLSGAAFWVIGFDARKACSLLVAECSIMLVGHEKRVNEEEDDDMLIAQGGGGRGQLMRWWKLERLGACHLAPDRSSRSISQASSIIELLLALRRPGGSSRELAVTGRRCDRSRATLSVRQSEHELFITGICAVVRLPLFGPDGQHLLPSHTCMAVRLAGGEELQRCSRRQGKIDERSRSKEHKDRRRPRTFLRTPTLRRCGVTCSASSRRLCVSA
ncbi:serine/arginine-rich splicing factor SR45a-like [Panicum miliaceum]|uniref:Serine/arginine-rich splicing factor SR45a-like n=1 Tax=Panicum miliaceum TaxID=4540 RepID=A0A3L6RWA9_PANMI|nr:serine/arginine-rich splicing factor SR45a-like [Panicum miliaceum]